MPALNYKKQFAPKVKSGRKRQTIRATRKIPIRLGDTLYHKVGMRTKQCEHLLTSECRAAIPIRITHHCVTLAGAFLLTSEKVALARNDGFETLEDFYDFFSDSKQPTFTGQLIIW